MIGDLLLKIAIALGILYILSLSIHEIGKNRFDEKYFKWLNRILAGLITLSLLMLTRAFYTPDFGLNYVFSRVSTDTPLIYRLSAMWVGQEGVFVVWSWAVSMSSLFFSEKWGYRTGINRRVAGFVTVLTVFFVILAVLMNPFEPTMKVMESEAVRSGNSLDSVLGNMQARGYYDQSLGFVQGQGMSPVLMSPWMALHPPIVFIAYALAAIPFAVCLVYLIWRIGDWEKYSRQWARLSWIFLSSGLIIGSFWAYEELSFGGYWTWDPIETASLIPWVTLTIFLHGSYEFRRKGNFAIISPAFGVLTTVGIIYGTFITKSGLIQSSHAYDKSVITPFLAAAIIISTALLLLATLRIYLKEGKKISFRPLVSTSNAFYLSAILFILLLGVLLWGISYPLFAKLSTDRTVALGKSFYNNKGFPLISGIILVSGFCLLLWVVKKGSALSMTAGVLALSLGGFFLKPTGSKFVDAYVPLSIFVVVSVFLRIKKDFESSRERIVVLKKLSSHLLHLGMAVLFIGVVASGSFQTGTDIIFPYPEGINTVQKAGGDYSLKLLNLFVFQDKSGNWVQKVNLTVYSGGDEAGNITLTMINDRRFGRHPKVSILRGLSSDLYAVYYGISGGHEEGKTILPINVKINPFVSLVWIGSILAVLALVVIFAVEIVYSKS